MALLEPRAIRALRRLGLNSGVPVRLPLDKGDPSWTCANWALSAFTAPLINPGLFYDYVITNAQWGDLTGIAGINLALLNSQRAKLDELRLDWVSNFLGADHTALKTAKIVEVSHEIARCLAIVNGLQISAIPTEYELCNHFPASAPGLGVEATSRGPNYDHWWLRICGRITVETFPPTPNIPNSTLKLHTSWEQPHNGLEVSRHYIQGLHANHKSEILRIIQVRAKNNNPPFQEYAARQPWQADAAANQCTWCASAFTFTNRRHHCRRCGYIFCNACSSQRDAVAQPANGGGAVNDARVCLSCYSGNN